jgi:subtilisin family serine protease
MLVQANISSGITHFAVEIRPTPARLLAPSLGKLSPDLRAAVSANGSFVGMTNAGKAVIQFKQEVPFATALESITKNPEVKGVEEVNPEAFYKITDLCVKVSEAAFNSEKLDDLTLAMKHRPGEFVVVHSDDGFTAEILLRLNADSLVSFIEPDYKYRFFQTPVSCNDPLFVSGALWGLTRINAPIAWRRRTSSNVIVAVIDTGIDYQHRDLEKNMWRGFGNEVGYDFLHASPDPMDRDGHGTHCAGIIAAVGDNGLDSVGVVWNAKLMALKVGDSAAHFTSASAIVQAIDYALANHARILSNSWGGYQDAFVIREAVRRTEAADCLFVAAAGNDGIDNDGTQPMFPASYSNKNIIAVLATDKSDNLASLSNFGRRSVHIGAPGVDIVSTIPGNKTAPKSGSSMATPYVAGAAALVWSDPRYQQYTAEQIKQLILDNCRKVRGLNGKCVCNGILDLAFLSSPTPSLPLAGIITRTPNEIRSEEPSMKDTRATFEGILTYPTFAAGGETTGIELKTGDGKIYQLDPNNDNEVLARVKELDQQNVIVTGILKEYTGVETGKQNVLVIEQLRKASY